MLSKLPKMAIGHFYNAEYGTDYYGVMADVIFGRHIIGNGYSIACPDINGGDMLFEADGKGVRLHNSRFSLSDDYGRQVLLDTAVGFALGRDGMYEYDDNGKIVFNESKATAYLDMNGKLHIKDGISEGDFYANNFYFNDGGDIKTLLSQTTKKIPSGLLDLGNLQLDGVNGNISMTGSINMGGDITMGGTLNLSAVSNINFGRNTFVKTKYSINKNATIPSGWSDTWNSSWSASTSTEVWAINSYDGGDTWVGPVLMQGKSGANGANGSDANVNFENVEAVLRKYYNISATEITSDTVAAPNIYGANLYGANIYAGDGSGSFAHVDGDEFSIHGVFNSDPYHFLKIQYDGTSYFGYPGIIFASPGGASAIWNFMHTLIQGNVNFTRNVSFKDAASIEWGDNAPVVRFG